MPNTMTAPAPAGLRGAKSGGKTRGRMPSKTGINFAVLGVKRTRWGLVALAVVLILAAAFCIGKFLVYDRLMDVFDAQAEVASVQNELIATRERIQSYGELNDLYAHYTRSGMTSEERQRVSRVAVMDLLEQVVFPKTDVASWELIGNTLTLTIEGKTLQEINETVQRLLADDLVSYCEVNTADTARANVRDDLAGPETVKANIVIYLHTPEEVAKN